MNKQQLASKIWESANKMRSKIEAGEYKDYILGFMFYKFLSDKEIKFLKEKGYSDEDIKAVNEDDFAWEWVKNNCTEDIHLLCQAILEAKRKIEANTSFSPFS